MGASAATPPTPDYTGAAIQQGKANKDIAQYLTAANRPNQVDPYGQTTWTTVPDQAKVAAAENAYNLYNNSAEGQNATDNGAKLDQLRSAYYSAQGGEGGTTTQKTTFTPEQQSLLNQQQQLKGTQNDRISQLLANFKVPTLAQTPALQNATQSDLANQMYQQSTQNYNQQFTRDEASQRQQLANQGFAQGSEGYNNAMNDFFRQKNQAYADANQRAQIAGYGQMNTQNQLNLNNYIAQHSANLGDYNTQMGYLSQLLGGVQGPQSNQPTYPGFAPATQYSAPDLMGAMSGQYQSNLNGTNAQNAANGSNMATLGTLGTIAAMAAFS